MALGLEPDGRPLGGPRVKDGGVPGEHRRFVDGERREGKDRARPIPQRAFMRAFEVLRDDGAGANKLTSEQDASLKTIGEQFRSKVEAYRDANKAEVEQLIKDLPEPEARRARAFLAVAREMYAEGGERGPRGERGGEARGERRGRGEGRGKGDAPKLSPEGEKARERLRELLQGAPKLEDVHAQMFGVITLDQRALVEKELGRLRDEMEKRRGEMRDEMGKGDRPAPGPGGEGGRERMLERLTPEQREKLKDMTPEQRREYVRSLRKDVGAKGNGGKGETPKE